MDQKSEHQSANPDYVDYGACLLELAKMVSLGLPKSNLTASNRSRARR